MFAKPVFTETLHCFRIQTQPWHCLANLLLMFTSKTSVDYGTLCCCQKRLTGFDFERISEAFPFFAIKEQTGCGWKYKFFHIHNFRFNLVMNETILIYIYTVLKYNVTLLLCWSAMLIIFCHEDSVFISLFSMTMLKQSPALVMHRHH